MAVLNVNGKPYDVAIEDGQPLLWAIREQVGLTGTKYGCGVGACGACTVHIDGKPTRSCSFPAKAAVGRKITTIEGISPDATHRVQKAWIALDVPQCGYCQSGQIMAAVSLLERSPRPSDAEIDEAMGNICRCGTYQRIRAAIHLAAGDDQGAGSIIHVAEAK
jgi:isoquinoline 1-oxidoreductase alpha subunit